MADKRGIFIVHEGDTTEIQWSDKEPRYGYIFGYAQIDADGTLTVPFRNQQDDAFVFVLDSKGGRVVASEDQPPGRDARVLWDAEADDVLV